MGAQEATAEIALPAVGQRYAAFRVVNPSAEAAVLRSLQKYGQLSPVVVNRSEGEGTGPYELLDGFKRFRAAQKLGFEQLKARVLALGVRASKVAILQLNWVGQSVNHLEEALVLLSLVREDGLQQQEVAVLVGRHDSWVSRRLSLVERLDEEVKESLRLGLVSGSLARELAQLPRGNQQPALACIHKHRLTWRETRRLVALLLENPRSHHDCFLHSPWEFLGERCQAPRTAAPQADSAAAALSTRLVCLKRCLGNVLAVLAHQDACAVPAEECPQVCVLIAETLEQTERVREALAVALQAVKTPREEASSW